MIKIHLFLLAAFVAATVSAADLETIALRTLSDDSLALFIANDEGERVSTTVGISIAAVRAITNRADVLALAAEMDAAAVAPQEFANGIAVPAETNGWFYSIVPADDGTLVPVLYRQSPVDWAAYEARKAAKLDAVKTNAVDLAQLKIDVAATIDGLQNDVDHTVFAGAQRDEFNDLRRLCLDLAREVRRLRKSQAQEAD